MLQTDADIVSGTPAARWPTRRPGDRHGHRERVKLTGPLLRARVRHPHQRRAVGRTSDRGGPSQCDRTDRAARLPRRAGPPGSNSSPQQQAQQQRKQIQQQQQGNGPGGVGAARQWPRQRSGAAEHGCTDDDADTTVPSSVARPAPERSSTACCAAPPPRAPGWSADDVITAINGQAVTSPTSLTVMMSASGRAAG